MDPVSRSNQASAPQSAEAVNALRSVFGEVKVLFVNENGLILGEEQTVGAPCIHGGSGKTLKEIYERGSNGGGMVVRERKDRKET